MSIGLAIVLVAIMGFPIYSRGFRRAVLIVVAVVGVALLFYSSSTPDYRDCVALMWDRKHPAEVKQRHIEQAARKCDKDRLSGVDPNCDPDWIINECEKLKTSYEKNSNENFEWKCIDGGVSDWLKAEWMMSDHNPVQENPCPHLSLEELRRADAEANRDKP
jgi:hypothetical protein